MASQQRARGAGPGAIRSADPHGGARRFPTKTPGSVSRCKGLGCARMRRSGDGRFPRSFRGAPGARQGARGLEELDPDGPASRFQRPRDPRRARDRQDVADRARARVRGGRPPRAGPRDGGGTGDPLRVAEPPVHAARQSPRRPAGSCGRGARIHLRPAARACAGSAPTVHVGPPTTLRRRSGGPDAGGRGRPRPVGR